MSSLDPESLAAFESLRTGKLSRRQFVQRLSALGFASSTIATFLAACGPAAPPAAAPPTVAPTAQPTRATLPAPAPAPTSAPAVPPHRPRAPRLPRRPRQDLGRLASADPNPKKGGTLRIAFGVTTSNYDLQQGATPTCCARCTATWCGSIRSTA